MSRYLHPRFGSLEAYVPGEQPQEREYIKLNTNESPYPPAPRVVEALTKEQTEALRLYSDPTCGRLKESLAALYSVGPEQIFIANGSDDILNFAFMAFGAEGAVFPDITYGFYPVFAALHGVPYRENPLQDDFAVNYKEYLGLNKLIVIANPNAPTGLQLPVSQIELILKSNPDSVVVIDEAYVDFGGDSCLPLIAEYDNLLVVRTFSKSRSLAGGRLGYAFGSGALIADLEKLKYSTNPYNVNRLTQLLGIESVGAEDYYQEKCRAIIKTREKTAEELRNLGFTVTHSRANFLFARSPQIGGAALYRALKERGILVRHFDLPRIKDFNRITVGTPEQMAILLKTIRDIPKGEL